MLQNLSQFVCLFIEMHYVHGESKNLLICSRYELSVKTKKFRIDIKRCNKVLFFKYRQKFVQNDKNCTVHGEHDQCARRSKSPTKSKSHLSKHFMLNRLMLLLGHSCISVIGADMYIWLYYKRVCLFNTIQCYIVVEQKSVTPPTCISLQIHLNTCIVWRTSFPLQNDGWGRGEGY